MEIKTFLSLDIFRERIKNLLVQNPAYVHYTPILFTPIEKNVKNVLNVGMVYSATADIARDAWRQFLGLYISLSIPQRFECRFNRFVPDCKECSHFAFITYFASESSSSCVVVAITVYLKYVWDTRRFIGVSIK